MKQVVDLTMMLQTGMAVYPGDPPVELRPHFSIEQDGCRVKALSMGTHSGTHVDLPAHFLKKGETADTISLTGCFGAAFAVRALVRDGQVMIPDGEIPPCEFLLLYTGYEKRLNRGDYFHSPAFSRELTDFLVDRKIRAVGVDMPTVDHDGECHRRLLESGILIYEGLVNLETVVGKKGVFYGFPLKLADGDASPVRAVFCME